MQHNLSLYSLMLHVIRTVYLLDDKRIGQRVEKVLEFRNLYIYIKTDMRHQFLNSVIYIYMHQTTHINLPDVGIGYSEGRAVANY